MTQWECVIGLEVHIQLQTKSKIFSGASTQFGFSPNIQTCRIDAALPGVLPVCNREAVRMAVMFGLAVGATINRKSIFERKNYFYPDLPKGYQISQYEIPIVSGGSLETEVDGQVCVVGLTRAHLEEDAGKSLHDQFEDATAIDLNRAGTPLLEIVSEPEIRSSVQAADYMRKLHNLVTYLGICDGNMQEGSFRCDANVSVRPMGQKELGTRTELKNINSFRFVEKGIKVEVSRQIEILESGGTVVQETRLYDSKSNTTRSMRSKEDAQDYRYFPDPDLPPLIVTEEYINEVRAELPELPNQKKQRFMKQFGLKKSDAEQLTQTRQSADYFEAALQLSPENARIIANWINVELASYLNKSGLNIQNSRVDAETLGELVSKITDGTISGVGGKTLLQELWEQPQQSIDSVIENKGLRKMDELVELEKLVCQVIEENSEQVQKILAGNHKILGFLVGQVIKRSDGKADPKSVSQLLKRELKI